MSLSISEDQIRNELKTVLDPETHLNIVEMGFIRKVQVIPTDDAFQIRIVYTLTTPGCPLAGMIQHQVQQALTRIIPDELLDSKKNPTGKGHHHRTHF
ncbi:metal-sulfur cluster assembly factor [Candidatus Woesebacteria bacterium]|nr:metal-sulfur cluster assembly factor [Candidatus Woesebacteria bacterium]